jgi:hypothetical protein
MQIQKIITIKIQFFSHRSRGNNDKGEQKGRRKLSEFLTNKINLRSLGFNQQFYRMLVWSPFYG